MKASDLLADPANWHKGSVNYASNVGPCCALGAIRRVYGGFGPAFEAARDKLHAHIGGFACGFAVSDWNDAPERTHAEVIAALKACDL